MRRYLNQIDKHPCYFVDIPSQFYYIKIKLFSVLLLVFIMDIEPQLKTIHVRIKCPELHVTLLIGERDGQVLL